MIALDANIDTLPDSRLSSDKGSVMVDWELPGGGKTRIEVVPVYCANCGAFHGHVPKENTTWACYLCQKCFETHGTIAGTLAVPDSQYWKTVEQEMVKHYGRALNQTELQRLAEKGWGPLAKLVKESPITTKN